MVDDLPDGWVRLRCPPGAENGTIAHGATAYRSYRERKDNDVWLVDLPQEAGYWLCRNAGFWPYQTPKNE